MWSRLSSGCVCIVSDVSITLLPSRAASCCTHGASMQETAAARPAVLSPSHKACSWRAYPVPSAAAAAAEAASHGSAP